jgi:hypothetical protein
MTNPKSLMTEKNGAKPRCMFGVDVCDGINGTSGFICRDCVEADEWDKDEEEAKHRGEGGPACELIEKPEFNRG